MRGDSLRDFYAKTLALLGLALLAGVGALVDYWPVSEAVPEVTLAAVIEQPARAAAFPVREMAIPVALAEAPAAVHPPAAAYSLAALGVSRHVPVSSTMAVRLSAPPALPDVTIVAADTVPATALPLSVPEPIVMPTLDPEPIYQLAANDADDGFLTGAFGAVKMTGHSIVRGSAKTGTTIYEASVGAFRAVGGAFRKLKFF